MRFIGQVCLHIRGIFIVTEAPQCNRTTVTGHRQQKNNIQMGNVQNGKNTIYNTCVRSDVQIWNEINKYVWWINNCVVCSTFNVKCPWDGLLGERNGFCVWSFWCSDLCSVDQTVIVKRGSVLDVRGPEWLCIGCTNDWLSSPDYPLLRSDLVAELNQTAIDVQRTDSMMAE